MKVRIEVELGDKFISKEKFVPDTTFGLHTSPNHFVREMQRAIWEEMRPAIEQANEEFAVAYGKKYRVDRPLDL